MEIYHQYRCTECGDTTRQGERTCSSCQKHSQREWEKQKQYKEQIEARLEARRLHTEIVNSLADGKNVDPSIVADALLLLLGQQLKAHIKG